jgi:hypothetical protein
MVRPEFTTSSGFEAWHEWKSLIKGTTRMSARCDSDGRFTRQQQFHTFHSHYNSELVQLRPALTAERLAEMVAAPQPLGAGVESSGRQPLGVMLTLTQPSASRLPVISLSGPRSEGRFLFDKQLFRASGILISSQSCRLGLCSRRCRPAVVLLGRVVASPPKLPSQSLGTRRWLIWKLVGNRQYEFLSSADEVEDYSGPREAIPGLAAVQGVSAPQGWSANGNVTVERVRPGANSVHGPSIFHVPRPFRSPPATVRPCCGRDADDAHALSPLLRRPASRTSLHGLGGPRRP